MQFRVFITVFFLCFSLISFGQDAMSKLGIKPNPVLNKNTRYTYQDIQLKRPDSTLHDFHLYNRVWNWDYPYHYLGNAGANYFPLFYNNTRRSGLQDGFEQFERYLKKEEHVKYYDTKVPFTSMDLVMGKNDEYLFAGNYSQNINPFVNIGFDYDGVASDGYLNRMRSSIHNFNLYNWYHSKNRKYNLMTGLIVNRLKIQENGGWAEDDVFANVGNLRDISLVPINLDEAQNSIKDTRFYVNQTVYFGKEVEKKWGDSLVCVTDARFALQHHFRVNFKNYTYSDNESKQDFYQDFNFDSTSAFDKSQIREVYNDVVFTNQKHFRDSSGSVFKVGFTHKLLQYQMTDRFSMGRNDIQITGAWLPVTKGKASFAIDGRVSLLPRYAGDLDVNVQTGFTFRELMSLKLKFNTQLSSQTLMEEMYQSNHFLWNNDFNKQFSFTSGVHFYCKKGLIKADLVNTLTKNFIYLDQNSLFQQNSQWLNVLHFRASKAFDWRLFHLYVEVAAQHISDRSVLRLPTFYTRNSFYYKGGFISGKLNAHLGFDIWYHTNNRTNAYNPALGRFHLQDAEKITMYPVMDVFFRLNIQTLRLFFMLQNAAAGLFDKGYYVAPGYGAQGRAIKFGVNWRFYD